MDITKRTADLVAAAIARSGLTEQQVAEKTGIPRVTLRRKVAGASPLTLDQLARISTATRTQFKDLLPTELIERAA